MPRRTGTRISLYQERPGDARSALHGATATAISDSNSGTETGATGTADRDSETDARLFLPASNVSPSLPSQTSKEVIGLRHLDLRHLFLLLGLPQDRAPGWRGPVALLGAPRLVGYGPFNQASG